MIKKITKQVTKYLKKPKFVFVEKEYSNKDIVVKDSILTQYSISDQLNTMREAIISGNNVKLSEVDAFITKELQNKGI